MKYFLAIEICLVAALIVAFVMVREPQRQVAVKVNCSSFSSHDEALAYFNQHKAKSLDRNNNGDPCESLK